MRLHAHRWALRTIGLALGLWLLTVSAGGGAEGGKDVMLPDAEFTKVLKRHIKGVADAIKDGAPDDVNAQKAHTGAIMIAAFAQATLDGPDAQRRATIRDAALKGAALIKSKKFAEATKLIEGLPKLAADPNAKKEPVKLIEDLLPFGNLMHQFRHNPDGGWGVFAHLQRIQTKLFKELPREEFNDVFVMEAYQVAVTADLLNGYTHKVRPKEWAEYTGELRKASLELAEALKMKDARAVPPLVSRMTTTCASCHKMLKVKVSGN